MYSVYQPWDPLRVCAVGRGYNPEFYSWIKDPSLRSIFEKLAIEGEEDFQKFTKLLERFNVEVLRPDLPLHPEQNGLYVKPPLLPRDVVAMIGNVFYERVSFDFKQFYNNIKDSSWPVCSSLEEFYNLPTHIQDECVNVHKMWHWKEHFNCWDSIISHVRAQGNAIKSHVRDDLDICHRAMIYPCGHDYYVGTWDGDSLYDFHPQWKNVDLSELQTFIDGEFPYTRNHIINTGGHADGTWVIPTPGLIFSDGGEYGLEKLFPGWEIINFPRSYDKWRRTQVFDIAKSERFYLIPGFENSPEVKNLVETHLKTWIGNCVESTYAVNLISIDEKNVAMFGHDDVAEEALHRHGVTAHPVDFRYQWFWDGGIHCVTSDLHREGRPRPLFGNNQ